DAEHLLDLEEHGVAVLEVQRDAVADGHPADGALGADPRAHLVADAEVVVDGDDVLGGELAHASRLPIPGLHGTRGPGRRMTTAGGLSGTLTRARFGGAPPGHHPPLECGRMTAFRGLSGTLTRVRFGGAPPGHHPPLECGRMTAFPPVDSAGAAPGHRRPLGRGTPRRRRV